MKTCMKMCSGIYLMNMQIGWCAAICKINRTVVFISASQSVHMQFDCDTLHGSKKRRKFLAFKYVYHEIAYGKIFRLFFAHSISHDWLERWQILMRTKNKEKKEGRKTQRPKHRSSEWVQTQTSDEK